MGEVFLRLASTFLNRKIVLFPVNPYNQDQPAKKIEIFPHNEHCGCETENQEYGPFTLLYYEETYFATPHFQSIHPVASSNTTENDFKIEQEIVKATTSKGHHDHIRPPPLQQHPPADPQLLNRSSYQLRVPQPTTEPHVSILALPQKKESHFKSQMEKVNLGFRIYQIWQILKHFVRAFHQA